MTSTALTIFGIVMSAGALAYVKELIVWLVKRRQEGTPRGKVTMSLADANHQIAVLRATRDDLQNEADYIRAALTAERSYFAAERDAWRAREIALASRPCYHPDCPSRKKHDKIDP